MGGPDISDVLNIDTYDVLDNIVNINTSDSLNNIVNIDTSDSLNIDASDSINILGTNGDGTIGRIGTDTDGIGANGDDQNWCPNKFVPEIFGCVYSSSYHGVHQSMGTECSHENRFQCVNRAVRLPQSEPISAPDCFEASQAWHF